MVAAVIEHLAGMVPSLASVDVVGVYKQDFTQVFAKARPFKARVKPESDDMEQPLETGATVVDHVVFNPIEIELALLIPAPFYRDVYQQIIQLYQSSELLIVQTKASTYYNQKISGLPHEESADMNDVLSLALKLTQVQFANTEVSTAPRNPANGNTKNRGNQQPNPATPEQDEKAKTWLGGKDLLKK